MIFVFTWQQGLTSYALKPANSNQFMGCMNKKPLCAVWACLTRWLENLIGDKMTDSVSVLNLRTNEEFHAILNEILKFVHESTIAEFVKKTVERWISEALTLSVVMTLFFFMKSSPE